MPEAEVVCATVVGTTDIAAFPRRPSIAVRFFRPEGGGLKPGETAAELSLRMLREIRREAPIVSAIARRRRPA